MLRQAQHDESLASCHPELVEGLFYVFFKDSALLFSN